MKIKLNSKIKQLINNKYRMINKKMYKKQLNSLNTNNNKNNKIKDKLNKIDNWLNKIKY